MIKWTLSVENNKAKVSFAEIKSFYIVKAIATPASQSWRFFPESSPGILTPDGDEKPMTFILTKQVRYESWPNEIISYGMVQAFLRDNKVLMF